MLSFVSNMQARRQKELACDEASAGEEDSDEEQIPGRDLEDPHAAQLRRQQKLKRRLEEKWAFPAIPGRRAPPGNIDVECMRAMIQIFNLDDTITDEVEALRECMCQQVRVSSFQRGLDYESPAFPLILRDVSCQRCCVAANVDVTGHPTRGPGLWVCSKCDRTYDKDAMQARLVELFYNIIQAWQSQELICKKCRGLRNSQMQHFCECFGRFEVTFKEAEFQQLLQVLASLTKPHDLPWLQQCLESYSEV
ncbi:unnamed protein product [Effrenium voratum]|nr:unnamed protein product [Effrenium voratum]